MPQRKPTMGEVIRDEDFLALPTIEKVKGMNLAGFSKEDQIRILTAVDADGFADLPPSQREIGFDQVQRFAGQQTAEEIAQGTVENSAISRYVRGLADSFDITTLIDAVGSPIETFKGIFSSSAEQLGSALESAQEGDVRGVQEGLVGSIPIAGPLIQGMTQRAQEGDVAGVAGELTGMGLPGAMARIRLPKIRTFDEPRRTRAIEFAERNDFPLDLATRSGNPLVEGIKGIGSRSPGSASVIREGVLKQEAALNRIGKSQSKKVSRFGSVEPVRLGDEIHAFMDLAGEEARRSSSRAHNNLIRIAEKKDTRRVKVGEKTVTTPESEILAPSRVGLGDAGPARPATTSTVPVFENIAAPIDYRPIKSRLAPVLENAKALLKGTRQEMSPAIAILEDIVNNRADFVSLDNALSDLSTLKSEARVIASFDRNKSQGKAAFGSVVLQAQINNKIKALGKDAQRLFNERNRETILKKEIGKASKRAAQLGPVRSLKRYMAPGDANINQLRLLQRTQPEFVAPIGRQWLASVIEEAGKRDISWNQAKKRWDKLGDQTKEMVFGKNAQDIDDFFDLADIAQASPNPSQSAVLGTLTASGLYIIRNPFTGTAYVLGQRQLARAMFADNGAKLLNRGLRIPIVTRGAEGVFAAILANAGIRDTEITRDAVSDFVGQQQQSNPRLIWNPQ